METYHMRWTEMMRIYYNAHYKEIGVNKTDARESRFCRSPIWSSNSKQVLSDTT